MKTNLFIPLLAFLLTASAFAAKTYQVTGPVVDISDSAITVQKGKENWEISRDPATKIMGDLKKGQRVTIAYTMAAQSVEVKDEKPAKDKKKK